MNTALTLNTTPAQMIETETDAVALLNTTRDVIETTNATLEGLDGAAKNEVAKALANLMNAVARKIEG